MHLTPREQERLLLAAAADLARRRLARGAPLGATEAVALVCDEICELAWDGVALETVIERARRGDPGRGAAARRRRAWSRCSRSRRCSPGARRWCTSTRPFAEDQKPPISNGPGLCFASSPIPAPGQRADGTDSRRARASWRGARGRRAITLAPGAARTVVLRNTGPGTSGSPRTSRSTRSTPPSRSGSPTRRSRGPFDMQILFLGNRERRRDGGPGRLPPRPARRGGAAAAAGRGADGDRRRSTSGRDAVSALDRGEYAAAVRADDRGPGAAGRHRPVGRGRGRRRLPRRRADRRVR